jgi:hypothetical protein
MRCRDVPQPGGSKVESRLPVRKRTDHARAPPDLAQDSFEWDDANVPPGIEGAGARERHRHGGSGYAAPGMRAGRSSLPRPSPARMAQQRQSIWQSPLYLAIRTMSRLIALCFIRPWAATDAAA